jgi:hypothetical protein
VNKRDEPNVFLSWSGDYSKAIASLLRNWLPKVVPDAQPWISTEDIAKGTFWPSALNAQLATCKVGIIILTPENVTRPWLLFEAGALFKAMPDRSVCTLVCGVEMPLTGPLAQFQSTKCMQDDMFRLVRDINSAIESKFDQGRIEFWFGNAWQEFETEAENIRRQHAGTQPVTRASDRALLEEVLATVRPLRRYQEALQEEWRSSAQKIDWYEPFTFSPGLSQCIRVHRKALEVFLRLQMRTPEKIERLLEYLAAEGETGGKPTAIPSNTTTFEDLFVTWYSVYSRGMDGSTVYIENIQLNASDSRGK